MISLAIAIAGRRLAGEDDGARRHVERGSASKAIVERDDVQDVQVLALVLVDALHLDVEQRVGIDGARRCARAISPASRRLLSPLDRAPRLLERRVVREGLELAQRVEFAYPAVADRLSDQLARAPGWRAAASAAASRRWSRCSNFSGHSS